ncbi:uncharacterized protein LOC124454395 isoform X2 [Xenia sp. Carnegie-2017]|uniref:uncharacterized protein LOC124454395 isoform X2 n=1 Tax=Xenia sp. Carnegie-2017 TaxID=2897299 RepID=UPI001F035D56|nr:uncharacterized protein LOC124454395 isoform X2 [Xenia sp. Carnegie-2017]
MALVTYWLTNCVPGDTLQEVHIKVLNAIYISTSVLGLTGAVVQLRYMWQYLNAIRRSPSAHPNIIFYMALSDLIACVGTIVLAVMSLVYGMPKISDESNMTSNFRLIYAICATLEAILFVGRIASVMWTFSFAVDVCLQMYEINWPVISYHILAWLSPIDIIAVILSLNWGFCCDNIRNRKIASMMLLSIILLFVFHANPVLFFITYKKVRRRLRGTGIFTSDERENLKRIAQKFSLIMAAFAFCWFPYVVAIVTFLTTERRSTFLIFLWYLDAIFKPLQGLFNYFLYHEAFRALKKDRNRPPRLLRPHPNAREIIEQMMDKKPSYPRKIVPKEIKNYNSIQKSDISLKNSEIPPYKSRLLGES